MSSEAGAGGPAPGRARIVRVLICDDSLTQRRQVAHSLRRDGRFEVVGEAGDPFEARELIKRVFPDVLVLDIAMPNMDGLEFLRRIMRLRPLPVVMLSSLSAKGSALAIEALSLGAVDCLEKSEAVLLPGKVGLAERLFAAAHVRVSARDCGQELESARPVPVDAAWNGRVILVGGSTGGVEALGSLLGALPIGAPPILIAQHMPAPWLSRLVMRLDDALAARVQLATDGQKLAAGHIYFAPGLDRHLVLAGRPGAYETGLIAARTGLEICPSVDHLFRSAVPVAGDVMALILSGMGGDGAKGMAALRTAGAQTYVQDGASATVNGMPGAALRLGAAEMALPPAALAEKVVEFGMGARPQSPGMRP